MKTILLTAAAFLIAGNLSASIIVENDPDSSPYYEPLADSGVVSYIYANSFVFNGTTGTTLNTLGIWLLGGSGTSQIQYELLADTGSNAPDGSSILTSGSPMSFDLDGLTLETEAVTPYALTNGTQYWIAVSTVGLSGAGFYQVGVQNSTGTGTFAYSNDPTGQTFAGVNLTPQMAIYAAGDAPAPAPEPASSITLFCGLASLALRGSGKLRVSKIL